MIHSLPYPVHASTGIDMASRIALGWLTWYFEVQSTIYSFISHLPVLVREHLLLKKDSEFAIHDVPLMKRC
jgi:hypothetical protein